MSQHHLIGDALAHLQTLTGDFIVGVYYPCWFFVRSRPFWSEAPRHLLYQLQCLRSQRAEVLDLVMPTVHRSELYGHSETILQSMLCCNDDYGREKG